MHAVLGCRDQVSLLGRERVSRDIKCKRLETRMGVLIMEVVMETFVTSSTQMTSSFSCLSTRAGTHSVGSLSCLNVVSR